PRGQEQRQQLWASNIEHTVIGRHVQVLEYVPELRAPDVFDGKHKALECVTWGDRKSACANHQAKAVHVPVRMAVGCSHGRCVCASLVPSRPMPHQSPPSTRYGSFRDYSHDGPRATDTDQVPTTIRYL